MRVAIITPAQPLHHKHFCAYLAERHDVVSILHPAGQRSSRTQKLTRVGRRFGKLGLVYGAMHALTAAPQQVSGWSQGDALRRAEQQFFAAAADDYDRLKLGNVAHAVADINGPESVGLIREVAPEVVLCLGGPIYRKALIDACGTMINYHSGISPLYNGASSAMFAFANGHMHLCGGTLMRMSTVVDGGEILAHYLPEVEADDDPASLFMKIVRGAAHVGSSFLDALEAHGTFTSVPQPAPLFYYTNEAWTLYQTQQVRLHLRRGTAARYVRPERTIPYWSGSPVEARESMLQTIEGLLSLR